MNPSILNQRYKLNKQISRKGARHTFLATDLTTQQLVIVKVLLFGPDFEWQQYKLFERGSQTLQYLDHPHIPRYLDYFDVTLDETEGFAQVQRYIEAPSIQEYIDRGRSFREVEISQIARQVLEILIYLQQLHPPILHRDIKPSNILLGEESSNSVGQIYLVDFDSVKTHSATPVGQTMTIVGTYGYMAPEQFGGKADPASDLYGLAATLVAIASGKAPSDLPQKEFRIDFEGEVNLSSHLVNWLKWLLEPSLDRRAKLATEALDALESRDRLPTYVPPVKARITQPTRSRIAIKQTADALEFMIPSRLIATLEAYEKIFVFAKVTFFVSLLMLSFNNLSFLFLWFIFILTNFVGSLIIPMDKTKIIIRKNEVTLQMPSIYGSSETIQKSAINKIRVHQNKVIIFINKSSLSDDEKATTRKTQLITTSQAEATWLAQELRATLR